jgi:hypothetical protein
MVKMAGMASNEESICKEYMSVENFCLFLLSFSHFLLGESH